jgi:hypothetical protein
MKFTTRELVTMAVFGALWGGVEISLGAVLHAIDIPFSGMILSAIGLAIAMIGRLFIPRRGSTFFIGVIATLLKLFSLGGVVIGPMVGILTEAMVVEIVLSAWPRPGRLVFGLAGALGVGWVLLQPLVTNPLLFGRSILVAWLDLLDQGSRLLGLNSQAVLVIILSLLVIHLLVGCLAGWSAWKIGLRLLERSGRNAALGQPFAQNDTAQEIINVEK